MKVIRPNFEKRGGLITVVVQNADSGRVLMVAYTDEAGYREMLRTGLVSLYSTSRRKSWVKGEESGNFMKVVAITIDCDGDAIVCGVIPQGSGLACHTNAPTCFYRDFSGYQLFDSPKAGEHEELGEMEAEVHEDIRFNGAKPVLSES